ncbi:nuclear transport factor 2 family protein [Ekhidna sp.]|uniref:nuclear transport factor 2 family protein n=1 Tax=Ekhidna sp. TaxID=2608089 RepID=UPI0032ED342B
MKTVTKAIFSLGLIILALLSFNLRSVETTAEEDAVKKVVLESYINGAFNELDAKAMENGFHKDFAIYTAKGEEISKYPINDWVAGVRKRKADGYDPTDEKKIFKHNFAYVDVTGGSAHVKVELSNNGKKIYTDYLSLMKFESGWKIVAKVYHKHKF